MGILDDLLAAIETYPEDYLDIEIYDVGWTGTVIDANEDVTFRIRVTNRGTLNVDDLTLLIEGLNGTKVKGNSATAKWLPALTSTVGFFPPVPAHQPNDPVEMTGGDLHFKPNRGFTNVTDLVRVSVADWTTNFDHLWAHTDADADAKGTYSSTVSAA